MRVLLLVLFVLSSALVTADPETMSVKLDLKCVPGADFKALVVSGDIFVTPAAGSDMTNGTLRVSVRDGKGGVLAEKSVDFDGSGPVNLTIGGLEAGESYYLDTSVTDGAGTKVIPDSDLVNPVSTALPFDGVWVRETPQTFAGVNPSTGQWRFRQVSPPEAKVIDGSVVGEAIQIETEPESSVIFESTNGAPVAVNSSVREFSFDICSEKAGYNLSAPSYAKTLSADLAGVTIVCDDLHGGEYRFSVYNPEGAGSWHVITDRTAELNRLYRITVVVTYPNPQKASSGSIAYYLAVSGGARERIAYFEPKGRIPLVSTGYRSRLRFAGGGLLKSIEGACYDAHAASVGHAEYWTVEDAIREIGDTGRVVVPLWYCTATAPLSEGRFGVLDNHVPPYLTLKWPIGYSVRESVEGSVRYFLYEISDSWIDWADEKDIVATASGSDILSANGLAWLAKASKDRRIVGNYRLKYDITNLNDHVWTPIREFSGTFDGNKRTITGLTDKGREVAITNSSGRSVFALFGEVSDSVFRNVAFEKVAISNSADVVSALAGIAYGNLAVTNASVASGKIVGSGDYVAGLVGLAENFKNVSLYANLNAASLTADGYPSGGAHVAGIANLGSDSGTPGAIVAVTNENRGAIASVISPSGGGNVAQILAGGNASARFDPAKVVISDNIGTGDVSRVTSLDQFNKSSAGLPIVNLAACVSRQDESADYHRADYHRYIEANDSTMMLIDPVKLTARMSSGLYQNGVTNSAGMINDEISVTLPGGVVTLAESCEIWSPIVLDRSITLNLNGKILDNVFDGYTFKVAADAGGALVKDGTVTCPTGKLATRPVGDQWETNKVRVVEWKEDYWERPEVVVTGVGTLDMVKSLASLSLALRASSKIIPDDEGVFSVDADTGTVCYRGRPAFSLAPLGYKVIATGDESYVVELDDDPATPAEISLALSPNGATSKVVVTGARADCEYCLQSVRVLSESWDKSTDEWVSPAADGASLEFTVDTSASSGFYRIKTRKK